MNCDPANPKSSGIVDVWQETNSVRFGAVDISDRLTLSSVFDYFQEAAISHAENLGVGRETMADTGQVWILSRITVHVKKRPEYRDSVIVRSWPRGWEKLFAIRDYEIKSKENDTLVSARSAWLIVDIGKRRPLRPQAVMDSLPQNEGLEALSPEEGEVASGLTVRENLQKTSERKALYSDLDFNGHVNNVRYVQWIEDSIDPQVLGKAEKMRLDINYLSEVMAGETIELFSASVHETKNAFAFEGRKKQNGAASPGQAAFRAELRLWE